MAAAIQVAWLRAPGRFADRTQIERKSFADRCADHLKIALQIAMKTAARAQLPDLQPPFT